MPPFRRHLLHLTTGYSSDDEQSSLASTTASPAQLKPTEDDSVLVTPVPPSPLLVSLHTRPPSQPQTKGAFNTKPKWQQTKEVQCEERDATWPLAVDIHKHESTDHHRSGFDDQFRRNDAVNGSPGTSQTTIIGCDEGQADIKQNVRNFSRPFRSTSASLFDSSSDILDAKGPNSAATTATTAKTSPTMTNAMKETQSTRAKRRSSSSTVTSQGPTERRGWSVPSRTSTTNQSPLAANISPARQNSTNSETRNMVARFVPPPGTRTSSLPSPLGRFGSGGDGVSVGRGSDANGGLGHAKTGSNIRAPCQQSLKRQRSSHASQASLNERYHHQESNESPRSPPKSVPGLIGIAWSGIADEWWPPRSSSRCRYTQTARNAHTAHRLSSINEMREEVTPAGEQKHDRSAKSQPTQQIDSDRTPRSEKRRSRDRATKKDQTDAAKDVWGSTIVIKKRREGEMMKVREKAVWW